MFFTLEGVASFLHHWGSPSDEVWPGLSSFKSCTNRSVEREGQKDRIELAHYILMSAPCLSPVFPQGLLCNTMFQIPSEDITYPG